MLDWVTPRALRPGDMIAFVAPAGRVDMEPVLQYAKQLEKAGFRVIGLNGLDRSDHYLAGSDEERAAELNPAIRDPNVNAILPCAGGYGVTRSSVWTTKPGCSRGFNPQRGSSAFRPP